MTSSRQPSPSLADPSDCPALRVGALDLAALSHETGVPVEMLRTFSAISDPVNSHLFTAEAAQRAFADIVVRPR